ncbi:hypothetical protein ACFX16_038592 [Malus domestica]
MEYEKGEEEERFITPRELKKQTSKNAASDANGIKGIFDLPVKARRRTTTMSRRQQSLPSNQPAQCNFDPRLQAKVLKVVDVSYGGEDGFNQAVKLSAEFLSNVKFIQEHNLLGRHFEEEQGNNKSNFRDPGCQGDLEVQERISLLKWPVDEHKRFGCDLKLVNNKSHEGRSSVKVLEALEGY